MPDRGLVTHCHSHTQVLAFLFHATYFDVYYAQTKTAALKAWCSSHVCDEQTQTTLHL